MTAPFNTPTNRWSVFVQDQWRIIPTLTVNAGVRYDYRRPSSGNGETAFTLNNQWAPRLGVTWDFVGDGTSKLYASAGRFYYSLPTDLNVRVFTANTPSSPSTTARPSWLRTRRPPRTHSSRSARSPESRSTPASRRPTRTSHARRREGARPDLFGRPEGHLPHPRPDDRGPLRPRLQHPPPNGHPARPQPGQRPAPQNPAPQSYVLDGSGNPTDPNAGSLRPRRRADPGRQAHLPRHRARRRASSSRPSSGRRLSYLYSSLRGNYSGAIREASGQTDPGINADFDYYQFADNAYGNLELDRPHPGPLDAVYNAPFGLSVGLQFYVRSGLPTSRLRLLQHLLPGPALPRHARHPAVVADRLRAEPVARLQPQRRPVTITPQFYLFNLLNRQTVTGDRRRPSTRTVRS